MAGRFQLLFYLSDTSSDPRIMESEHVSDFRIKKKHRGIDREMTVALYLLRCLEIGIPISDLDGLDIGMIFDMYLEKSNDSIEYPEIATQDDFDRF